jgi:hypothetical protein
VRASLELLLYKYEKLKNAGKFSNTTLWIT